MVQLVVALLKQVTVPLTRQLKDGDPQLHQGPKQIYDLLNHCKDSALGRCIKMAPMMMIGSSGLRRLSGSSGYATLLSDRLLQKGSPKLSIADYLWSTGISDWRKIEEPDSPWWGLA